MKGMDTVGGARRLADAAKNPELQAMLEYEQTHQNRRAVVDYLERRLADTKPKSKPTDSGS